MKTIKYEDTYLTIKNYKEPLLEIPKEKGFGYYGTILLTTDCKRGLIPDYGVYKRHFGSLTIARDVARVNSFIN